MVNKKDTLWRCAICEKGTTTLHEIFFGTANKQTSIDYNIQVPLCDRCHNHAHGKKDGEIITKMDAKSQIEYKEYFCKCLGLDYDILLLFVNNSNFERLDNIKDYGIKYINSRED